MKRTIYSLIFAIFFIGMFIYLSTRLSPWNDKIKEYLDYYQIKDNISLVDQIKIFIETGIIWQVLNPVNVSFWLISLAGSLVSLVTTIHLLIDKLFFCKFYEEPGLFLAIRRGLIFALMVISFLGLRLIGGLYWYNIISIILLFVAIELLFQNFARNKKAPTSELKTENTNSL